MFDGYVDFYIVCKWLRIFLMFRARYLPSAEVLDGAASVSWSTSPRPRELWWIWARQTKEKKRKKRKPPLLLQVLLCLLSRSFSCLLPSTMPTGVSSGWGSSSAVWSVGVSDGDWPNNFLAHLAIRPKCFLLFFSSGVEDLLYSSDEARNIKVSRPWWNRVEYIILQYLLEIQLWIPIFDS